MAKLQKVLVLFLIIGGLFFTSCEKKNELLEKDVDVTEQKILNFKEKVKKHEKSNEKISIDSAVWYIEAALNYTYCRNYEDKQQAELNAITVDSTFIEVGLANDSVALSDAINAFQKAENDLITSFNKISYKTKFYDIIDVKHINNKIITYFVFAYNSTCSDKSDCYSVDQDWYYGYNLGKCDGTCVGKDATDVLYAHINPNVAYPANQYFTDVDNLFYRPDMVIYGNQIFATTDNPNGDFLLFYIRVPQTSNFCMSDKFMNYHVVGTKVALDIMKGYIPTGYKFKSWRIHHFFGSDPGDTDTEFGHALEVYYGIAHNISPSH